MMSEIVEEVQRTFTCTENGSSFRLVADEESVFIKIINTEDPDHLRLMTISVTEAQTLLKLLSKI